ncbi:ABC transporter permease [Allokutzneria sp. A3M-2-11 16]|uniref:ABC transporter permease n=1 Tax=Allokutzneria sp. A3M-2-11 16 TaxID=2962043 RepID=UPI0020B7CC89|nr:ABC transporter permease [Allokutzneria sp. A3M-2-11 16]MCP3800746.1 ABC transporter permease [Allokutzneria sp. A3M-2-11 16]
MTMNRLARITSVELRLFLREPMTIFFGIALPPLLLVIFGSIPSFAAPSPDFGGERFIDVYAPALIATSLAMLALSSLPTILASYREKGVLRRLATTPVRPGFLLTAQVVSHLLMALVSVALLLVVGATAFDLPLPANALGFAIAVVLATTSVFAIGLLIAALARTGRLASGIGSLLFFPVAFLAGLWTPGPVMPEFLRGIASFSPLGAGSQAIKDAWSGAWPQPLHLLVMLGFTALAGLAAARWFRWE